MLKNLFGNIPPVTKNLLILNVLFFLATFLLEQQGIDLASKLGLYYPSSQFFEPYQIITHFFMHSGFTHLLFNMLGLVFIGSHLERVWGNKRFFIFYFVTAIGAALLYESVHAFELYSATGSIFPDIFLEDVQHLQNGAITWRSSFQPISITGIYAAPTVGASGAIYGLLMAFALLFPNTEFRLLFPPIPIKAKWLALILGIYALYQGYLNNPGDSVAHFAHLGGMLFGFIMIKIWGKDRNEFY